MYTNITINHVTTKSHLLLAEREQSSITAYSPDTALWAVKQVPAAMLYTGVSFCNRPNSADSTVSSASSNVQRS